jgi:hypothetical protein
MTTPPSCPTHGPMKARKGRYGNFWSCGVKDANGAWCQYKPPKDTPPPDAESMFSASLDKTAAAEDRTKADAKRSDDMAWGNAKNCASVILAAKIGKASNDTDAFDVMKEFVELSELIYKMPKPE